MKNDLSKIKDMISSNINSMKISLEILWTNAFIR